jgi:hypothetical protein
MKSIITKDFGITNAENFESMVSLPLSRVYVMVGRTTPWANTSNPTTLDDITVQTPYDTTSYKNQIFNDAELIKRVTSSDIQPVIPRVDWANNEVYVAYDQTANLFTKVLDTAYTSGSVNVGSGLLNTINANGINFTTVTPSISIGSIIKIGDERKEVVSFNSTALVVNTSFASAYSSANLFKTTVTTTQYANKFYVRNTKDQVFKCLFNNGGIVSNTMPQISIGGELPENPYVETADGYKWKFMYTIPTGLKNKFFTDKYMPVLRDTIVFDNAKDGRIDIVKIIDGGSGYYGGTTVSNYAIVDVDGDGTLADITVDVVDGVITDINIVNGGNNYTRATITLDDPIKQLIGNTANLQAIISPQYGHGSDAARELGASSLMISMDFSSDVNGNLPTQSNGKDTIRQFSLVRDIKLKTGSLATGSVYPMYTKVFTSNPPVDFDNNAEIYVGSSYETAVFKARVVHFDSASNVLYLNNLVGDLTAVENEAVRQKDAPSSFAKAFNVVSPDINIFSGEILYVENRDKITRNLSQTETLKLVVEF